MKTPSTASSNPPSGSNVYQIGGVPVEFPYKPYGTQLAFMGRVISTLDRAQRDGHCHALLESPTGTGKTLSLLCSALAWQRSYASRYGPGRQQQSPSTPQPTPDPLAVGGGFIPEEESTAPGNTVKRAPSASSARARRKLIRPVIYYASRTHTQISQVIRELRKTTYRVPMAILASRKHYCTNKHVCGKADLDEECKTLLKDERIGCMEYKNMNKVKGHSLLQKGGLLEAHDIEDLVKVGHMVKGCPYFAAQCMAAEGDLVFCPYSYIINPVIRKMMDIDIKGAVLILDEAHNIEDMAREAGSLDIEEETLFALQSELGQLCMVENMSMTYQPLYDMIEGIISWIQLRKDTLQKHDFEHYCTCWTGDKAIKELQVAGISQQHFPILKGCATKAIRISLDAESNEICLSGMSTLTLEGLFASLGFLLSDDGRHAHDYQLALQRHVKRDSRGAGNGWKHTFSLWCLDPSVVFKEMANLSLSVILSSGTLSPMGSFASELGIKFETSLEAPHVIDAESQLWAAVISNGPGNFQLNASYKMSDGFAFQDSLGMCLEEICKIVPGGVLIFFPSYKLLEKLQNRWCQTGQWSRLNVQKSVYVEPRSKNDDFETILKNYYSSIKGLKKVVSGRTKSRKRDNDKILCLEPSPPPMKKGAAFLAVCRGKVSEGMDFSDENARAVVIVGIPFPNKHSSDSEKKYNDTHKSSKSLLSGSEWYCHQAFRALNQAAGRCLRHRLDYGAIILIDERFWEERNLAYISRWIRKSIKHFDKFNMSLESLRAFFLEKEKLGKNNAVMKNDSPMSDFISLPSMKEISLNRCTSVQRIPRMGKDSNKATDKSATSQKKIGKTGQSNYRESTSNIKLSSYVKSNNDEQPLETTESTLTGDFTGESIRSNLFRLSESHLNHEKQQKKLMDHEKEQVLTNISNLDGLSSVQIISEGTCHPQTTIISHRFVAESIFQASSIADSTETSMQEHYKSVTTPEREVQKNSCSPEPMLCLSVNSHKHKRKTLTSLDIGFPDLNCTTKLEPHTFCPTDQDKCGGLHNGLSQGAGWLLNAISQSSLKELPNGTVTKKCFIHCLICRSPLGLQENQYLVSCTFTSTSKDYVAFLLNNGPFTMYSPFSSSTGQFSTPVAISDKASVTQLLFQKSLMRGIPLHDIWSEPDGCVFRALFCPFCTDSGTVLGLEIKAYDQSNEDLKNKVFLYAGRLYIADEQRPDKQGSLAGNMDICHDRRPAPIESFAYDSPGAQRTKSRLKLLRRDHAS